MFCRKILVSRYDPQPSGPEGLLSSHGRFLCGLRGCWLRRSWFAFQFDKQNVSVTWPQELGSVRFCRSPRCRACLALSFLGLAIWRGELCFAASKTVDDAIRMRMHPDLFAGF